MVRQNRNVVLGAKISENNFQPGHNTRRQTSFKIAFFAFPFSYSMLI